MIGAACSATAVFAAAAVRSRSSSACRSDMAPCNVTSSSDSDFDLFGWLIDEAGFRARLAYERSFYIESMVLYELRGR